MAGKLTYEQYARLADEERYLEELKACGLTQEEIELKLHYKSDDHVSNSETHHKKLHSDCSCLVALLASFTGYSVCAAVVLKHHHSYLLVLAVVTYIL